MKRSLIDKIASGVVFLGTIVLFLIDYSEKLLENLGYGEIAKIIPFISALSLFCFIWSFIWDNKIIKLYEKMKKENDEFISSEKETNQILVQEAKTNTEQIEKEVKMIAEEYEKSSKSLEDYVKTALQQPNKIESRILFEKEKNIATLLSLQATSSDFAQIYVITNAATVENERFGKAICDNIIKNHQYVYVSPFDEDEFMIKLHNTLFDVCPDEYDKNLLEAAFQKNIRHLRKQDLFKWLPEYSDMVIYVKKRIVNYDQKQKQYVGYFSFQDQVINTDGVECYYYNQMSASNAQKIATEIEKELADKPNLSIKNYLSNAVEIRKSNYNRNGLFCKTQIKKGDTIFKKGGAFILKNNLNKTLKKDVQYIQISDDYVVSSLKQEENTKICFPINHSCRNPNCGFESPIEIVATQNIDPGQEILIDYAFFDPDYCKDFNCKFCSSGQCMRKTKNFEEILNEVRQSKEILAPYLREKI